ncbi:unnamed protein product [Tilletia laevis]|uniref:Uncharacterized protein n=2 Tax=Tilletia TaxID=13289 RepID=A0A9N8M0N4_9BASI|nr:hypothetical protein CF335_g6155 [Tilletia laevis]CAD6917018.1 unnamed protein product [Tilletia caries]CAD6938322.1 unnamed protein product [Tilletia laevis]CAD6949577.1 unnamed protein product [Tilletia caries]
MKEVFRKPAIRKTLYLQAQHSVAEVSPISSALGSPPKRTLSGSKSTATGGRLGILLALSNSRVNLRPHLSTRAQARYPVTTVEIPHRKTLSATAADAQHARPVLTSHRSENAS